MSTFWVVAGTLMLVVVAALAVPLLRRARSDVQRELDAANVVLYQDQIVELERDRAQELLSKEQFEQARLELGQRLLADVRGEDSARSEPAGSWRYVALAGVPIVAVLSYLVLGAPESLDPKFAPQPAGTVAGQPHDLAQLLGRLTARLERNPDDGEAWALLARSNQILGRPAEAAKAFAKATALIPRSAQLWADYADTLVASAKGQWTQAAKAALAKALALDHAHPKALWLAGTEAFARRDFKVALKYWEQLAAMVDPGSDVARAIQGNIAEVRALMGESGAAPVPAGTSGVATSAQADASTPAVDSDKSLSGVVAIDPAIAARVKPGDTVFVFARAAQGPKMPLAIRRITVKDLPYKFLLDDSSAMAPGMQISAFDQIVVGARVSMSGNAAPSPGDFEGYSAPVKPGTNSIQVRIHAEVR